MFKKRQVAVGVLVLATALSGCGSDTKDKDVADAPSTPESSATTTAPAPPASPTIGSLVLTPGTDLKDQQKVKADIAGYGEFTGTVIVTLCTPAVVADPTNSSNYCDTRPEAASTIEVAKGVGTGEITIRIGDSFKAGSPDSKCDAGGKCLVLATSAVENPEYVSFSEVAFAG